MPRYNKIVAENRKARFDYHIFETCEAGLVLRGSEVKSVRIGRVNLRDSFARAQNGELWVHNVHISPYGFAKTDSVDPRRPRKLLLKRSEMKKLIGKAAEKGLSIIPLKIYFSGDFAKVELAVAKGKKLFDKRDDIKKKDLDRDAGRELIDRDRSKKNER